MTAKRRKNYYYGSFREIDEHILIQKLKEISRIREGISIHACDFFGVIYISTNTRFVIEEIEKIFPRAFISTKYAPTTGHELFDNYN